MKSDSELLRGIEEETEQELRQIREELARLERERKSAADREIESIRQEIENRTAAQRKKIDREAQALVSTETHKIALAARERFFKRVLDAAADRMRALITSEDYAVILRGWIVEAAVGLAAEEATVSASSEEWELCRQLLPEAERELREILGREVRLTPAATTASGQGVVLTAKSGRTAYNNQVRTRMMRRQTAIRRIIYEELSGASYGVSTDG